MRIKINVKSGNGLLQANYMEYVKSALHSWNKCDDFHNSVSLYSLSPLKNIKYVEHDLIQIYNDSYFLISAHDSTLLLKIIEGIQKNPTICKGLEVDNVQIVNTPRFGNEEYFYLNSPILIKRFTESQGKKKNEYVMYDDERANAFLKETLQRKMSIAGIEGEIDIRFDLDYNKKTERIIKYKGFANICSLCPVILKGSSDVIEFAWNVGLGNSTGIGLGNLM